MSLLYSKAMEAFKKDAKQQNDFQKKSIRKAEK